MAKKWDINKFPKHIQGDVQNRNKNIDNGHELCERCEGTGNEFFSMYRRCTDCNGTGIKK